MLLTDNGRALDHYRMCDAVHRSPGHRGYRRRERRWEPSAQETKRLARVMLLTSMGGLRLIAVLPGHTPQAA